MKFILVILLFLSNQHVHDTSPPAVPKLWGLSRIEPNATVGFKIEWAQDAPSMNEILRYVYRVYFDKGTAGKQLSGIMCKGNHSPFECSAPMPSITTTIGKHIIRITASRFVSGDSVQYPSETGQEAWSELAEFTVRQPPPYMYTTTPYDRPPVVIK